MQVTIYKRPHGRSEKVNITNVRPSDAEWFEQHHAHISIEDVGNQFAVYADIGIKTEDDEPYEVIVLSGNKSCEETLADLRKTCTQLLKV